MYRATLRLWLACWAIALACIRGQAAAQVAPQDAPFVPTPQPVVEAMLQLANVGARDVLYDLGSGDGRVVITAAKKFGARGVGVELDPHLVIQSEEAARQAGVEGRVKFLQENLFGVGLAEATVVTMYLWPRMYDKLAPRLLRLQPGTRIVIYRWGFTDWKPDRQGGAGEEAYYLYFVPAQLAGRWRVRTQPANGEAREYVVEFRQRYQELQASAHDVSGSVPVAEARIAGDRVSFVLGNEGARGNFEGRVAGNVMTGAVRHGDAKAQGTWRAERLSAPGERG
jgi:hypothetical protein